MSLRSKVVIESNLKPSKFGKPAVLTGSENNDDFEDIYENPLEKSKPSPPPLVINGVAGLLQELPRNEPEVMEFSNARKSLQGSSSFAVESSPPSNRNSGGHGSSQKILTMDSGKRYTSQRNSDDVSVEGFTNEGFSSSDQSSEQELIQDLSTSGNRRNAKIVANQGSQDIRTANNGKNGHGPEDNTDVSFRGVINVIKSLDVNRYATKKTIAQGMLDIALLTANASQLKYILQVGKQHEFYILMLSLISVSIGLQILSGLLSLSLNLMSDCRMEDNTYARSVEWVGRARVTLSFVVFLDNLFIATFDPTGINVLLTSETVIQGVICVLLGSGLNINKQRDQRKANIWNNICLILMVLTVAVNAVISAFDMRDSSALTGANATKGASTSLTSGGR